MKEKDISEKIFEDYNDVFADIVNGLLFKGQQRVKPSDLLTMSVHSQYKADDSRLHELERDVTKEWRLHNIRIAIYGLENQSEPEKNMVPRVFGYEGSSYRSQLLADKNAKIVPVVTLVLYFGTDRHWNYSKSIKDLLNIPEGLSDFVNDFKINVFEIAWLSDEEINRFTSDFKIVAKFFANKRKNKDYIPDDKQEIKHVDEILKLLHALTGDNRYEEILALPGKERIHNMCDVAERLENMGIKKGRIEGVSQGQSQLVNATKDARNGFPYEALVEKYGEETAKNALILK